MSKPKSRLHLPNATATGPLCGRQLSLTRGRAGHDRMRLATSADDEATCKWCLRANATLAAQGDELDFDNGDEE